MPSVETQRTDDLHGEAGDDSLDGGAGNDLLQGGTGSDTYLFGRGDGQDTVRNNLVYQYTDQTDPNGYPYYAGAYLESDQATTTDVLKFKAGITAADLDIRRFGAHLFLGIKGTTDQVKVEGFFANNDVNHAYGTDRIEFADGSTLSDGEIRAALVIGTSGDETISALNGDDTINAGAGNDLVYGANGNDSLDGEAGDDTLYAGAGNDALSGNAGTDGLYGEAGDDSLDGGAGNDLLQGGTGSDTYLFGRGDGQDTVRNNLVYQYTDQTDPNGYPYYAGAYLESDQATTTDVLKFKAGITAADLDIRRFGAHLLLGIKGTTDQVKVEGFFANNDVNHAYGVDRIEFADGSTLSDGEIRVALTVGTSGDDTISALNGDDTINAEPGNDLVYAASGNDSLDGEAGDDTLYAGAGHDALSGNAGTDGLYGEAGDDSLDGGAGNDLLQGGTGSDTYLFGRGDGQDTVRNNLVYQYTDQTDPNGYPYYAGAYLESDQATTTDVLKFKAGITAADLDIRRFGAHLFLGIKGTTDQVKVEGFFANNDVNHAYGVDRIEFADGSTLSDGEIRAALLVGTSGNDDHDVIQYRRRTKQWCRSRHHLCRSWQRFYCCRCRC